MSCLKLLAVWSRFFKSLAILTVGLFSSSAQGQDVEMERVVTYEEFGAVGDGVHDDLSAICRAHAFANEKGFSVRSNPAATYHLGRQALTAIIATDTDWSTSRFTVDDRDVEDHKKALFEVRSQLPAETLAIERLKRDQGSLPNVFDKDYYVIVRNDKVRRYKRRGLNQDAGSIQRDCFILQEDGTISSPIDWDYDSISEVVAKPIDMETLTIHGGVFTTFANNMKQEVGYNYWARNIVITRSNTVVDGLTHYVVGETQFGHPYRGFLSVSKCANVTLKNCFATGRKVYTTIGSAGKPVSMGSYDYSVNSVVNFKMINCKMNHILDETRWGVVASNFCKNILLEDCELSRMDAHMGVSGYYIIRRSTLGYMGLNAIGRGKLVLEDSTLHGTSLVRFRSDYGSTWEGTVDIRNCRWIPTRRSGQEDITLFELSNDGTHDFGYSCFMPNRISIDGLYIDDSSFEGRLDYFSDPGILDQEKVEYPYHFTQELRVRNNSVVSGKELGVSMSALLTDSVSVLDTVEN